MGINDINVRALPNKAIQMPEPVVAYGIPSDRYLYVESNDDLVIHDAYAHDSEDDDVKYVWRMSSLQDPGTSEIRLDHWPEVNAGPTWISSGDYRPRLMKRADFLMSGRPRAQQKAVHFGRNPHEHMWLDLNEECEAITVMIAVMFDGYRRDHNILDAGKATPSFDDSAEGKDHFFHEYVDYRAAMVYKHHKGYISTADRKSVIGGKHIRVKHAHSHRPKILYAVFNGDKSKMGWISEGKRKHKNGKVDEAGIRYLVLGRKQNNIGKSHSTHMTVFEVRVYTEAKKLKQIKRIARKMRGRYNLNGYGD